MAMGLRLAHRLPLLMFAAMLPLVLVLFYNLYALQSSKEQEAHAEVFRSGQLVALEFERIIAGMQNVLVTISAAPSVQALDTEKCGAFLAAAVPKLPGVVTLGVIDLDGKILCRQEPRGVGMSLKDRPYFQDALRTGGFVVGEYTKSRVTGKALLPMAMPLKDGQGKVKGVVALSLNLDWLQRILVARDLPKDGNLTVADRNGVILARQPLPERFVGTTIPYTYRSLVTAGEPGTLELTSQDGTRRILAYFPVTAAKPLYVSTGVSVNDTFSAIRQAMIFGLATTLFAIVLAAALSWQSVHYAIQRPVQRILHALEQWRTNDARARTGMKAASGEFGAIGAAVDTFMDDLQEANTQRDLLIGELDHRVKNLLAMIQAVAGQSFRDGADIRDARRVFSQRLRAIGDSFSLLGQDKWQSAGFMALVWTAIAPFDDAARSQFRVSGPDFQVSARTALAFSMALHELCTNAAKYGALAKQEGTILITWFIDSGEAPTLVFRWEEQDGPAVKPPEKSGFGSEMIQRALASQIGATIELDYNPTGVKCRVRAPIAKLSEEGATPS